MATLVAGTLLALYAAVPSAAAAAATAGDTTVGELRVDALVDPLGIDDASPSLSWEMVSARRSVTQTAYEVRAATSAERLDHPDLWQSGRVNSDQSIGVPWGGVDLRSRQHVVWQVRVWDSAGRVSRWSKSASWEMGLLDASDWSARWIANPDWLDRKPQPVVVTVPPQDARYVRITTTKLGLPLKEGSSLLYRLQLAEVAVQNGVDGDNLARGAGISSSDPKTYPGKWEPKFATDGELTTNQQPFGYSSAGYSGPVPTKPISLTVDLGQVRHLDRVLLYPRTDTVTDDGHTPNAPADFTVETAGEDGTDFATGATVTGQVAPPPFNLDFPAMPLFAKQFTLDAPLRSARLYATGLGIYDARVNGRAVSKAVLQPPNTDYHERLVYSTTDVTGLLKQGENALSMRLGAGTSIVPDTPDRYTKWSGVLGPPKLLAQLELTYADGRVERIASDQTWRTALGPTTFTQWYGGEDADARLEQPGWDRPDADLSGWKAAGETDAPTPGLRLTAQMAPPIQQVDRVSTVKITQPEAGTYLFDLGLNIAGWPELRVSGPAGTTVTLKPGERLGADGLVDQSTMIRGGATYPPILDHYTLAGRGEEVWHPNFVYHGFRYVQITGLPSAPTPKTLSGIVLRAANEESGSFSSSSALLDGIHSIINRAIQGNMYSILTDCPDREKLGWLEETHLVFGAVSRNYDVAAYYRELVRNMVEAQEPSGLVPDIAPQYVVFSGDVHDEPNWGSAVILAPWQMYRAYGDIDTLRFAYDAMRHYFDYLSTKAKGDLLDYGLGDWAAIDKSTPDGMTATFAYHRDAVTLAKIARLLGHDDDAARYDAVAERVAAAFNTAFLHADTGTYATGSQASDALALDMGVVPEELRGRVLEHLVQSVRAAGNHVTVGEVALPSLLRVLSVAGRDDVVYDIASQTSNPSYGYQVVHGATALAEYWDGPTGYGSQNHFMLGALDEWFTAGIGGIRQAEDSVGFRQLEIRPSVVGRLTHAESSYRTPYGEVRTEWRRTGTTFHLDVDVPPGTTASVEVPLWAGHGGATATAGARPVRTTEDSAVYEVGSGTWSFVSHTDGVVPEDREQLAVDAPAAQVPVLPGEAATATFTVHNLMDDPVTVRVGVEASTGFTATAKPSTRTIPPHTTVAVPVQVERTDASAASGQVKLTAGDSAASAPVTATDNWARGATMSASSAHSGSSAEFTNDGVTDSGVWSNGVGGWNDDTSKVFPDTLTATWSHPVTLSRVRLFTLDSAQYPAARVGVRDATVEASVDGSWRPVATIAGNTAGVVERTFAPVEATALRLVVTDSNDHTFSRVLELEAYA
ncbi:alpha-L-rhamnosidase [Streptosporangium album]|uniref:alpha-L-rhamnosidase n=1 Tax=Streptosporangium album TaxID=47479 RepID=A0A7W7S4Y1_9ACTN|nr:family 78 glycoside hydrolase catalytic domain [Streptosporangium album]MBB4943343.1 alpha-L-rhamnosidase [Streptosporangium album]